MTTTLSAARFQELLMRARSKAATSLSATMSSLNIETVDFANVLPPQASLDEKVSFAEEIIQSLSASKASSNTSISQNSIVAGDSSNTGPVVNNSLLSLGSDILHPRLPGVARKIVLNAKQREFSDLVLTGSDAVLIGAAGTGKTSSMREITERLIEENKIPKLATGTKKLAAGSPGIAIISYTRKAVSNIRHAVCKELKANTLTVHMLLEFAPEFFDIEDPNSPGDFKHSMRFVPSRNIYNPLPTDLKLLIMEEAGMISTGQGGLYDLLQAAMPHKHQEIFIGDLNQLPPIFGQAILGFKMLELPVVELTEIYRTALMSPITTLAWAILGGYKDETSLYVDKNTGKERQVIPFSPEFEKITKQIKDKKVERNFVPGLDYFSNKVLLEDGTYSEVVFQPWQKPLGIDIALLTAGKQFCAWAAAGTYFPETDIILCPFNKSLGTIEINKAISDYLGKQRGAEVYEVLAGFQKHYLAVGDRVLFDKEDAFIVKISRNGKYLGKMPQPHHTLLDRWGHLNTETLSKEERIRLMHEDSASFGEEDIDNFLAAIADTSEERVQAASHIIEVRYAHQEEFDTPIVLESASEINALLGGYCITVHKFQGSEAERVFLLLHNSHATMIQRELLYTAVTRARSYLHIICERDTFFKGIKSQKIKGNTLAEKAEWFKGKRAEREERIK